MRLPAPAPAPQCFPRPAARTLAHSPTLYRDRLPQLLSSPPCGVMCVTLNPVFVRTCQDSAGHLRTGRALEYAPQALGQGTGCVFITDVCRATEMSELMRIVRKMASSVVLQGHEVAGLSVAGLVRLGKGRGESG